MSIEWFDRVADEILEPLQSICEEFDQIGHMEVLRAAKHPRLEFFVETDEGNREYFCVIHFDPHNEEFYVKTMELDFELTSKTILDDIEEIVEEVHESFHVFMEEEEYEEEYAERYDDEMEEEVEVEWTTPEVTAFSKFDEVEVTYQFGIIEETRDGVLRRVSRVKTDEDEWLTDETNFIFSKEEANTIVAMIASHADDLSEMNEYE
ncbi:hypothetical protein JOC78_000720 [Bacillus ectoiniformans]|uniref:hypothetical protein n=1 Tax=Bacillus ectoiniformans TaxID=1494429 RepID=UPI00195D4139|nr:hypothetical protein [Bacillus ectoiniformans]MBM7647780.1 hypothetical protein [Bacillus ectoiniformans]